MPPLKKDPSFLPHIWGNSLKAVKPSLPSITGMVSTPALYSTATAPITAFVNNLLAPAVLIPIAPYPCGLPVYYPQQHYQAPALYNQSLNNWNQSFQPFQPNPSFCCETYRDWKANNRIGAIRILALRVTPIFTSKKHALNT
jgi:hypothetical protein